MNRVTAFAPATVANVAVGFDILGFALDAPGDEVQLTRRKNLDVVIEKIEGLPSAGKDSDFSVLPRDPLKNTATVGLFRLIKDMGLDFGFSVVIRKGIAIGSGLGGSAASAVGAIVAANRFLPSPLSYERLVHYALFGEAVASGDRHADNISPCVFGGLTLTKSADPVDVLRIPVPREVFCSVVHPHLRVDTMTARSILRPDITLKAHVKQSSHLAGFILGCAQNDIGLIRRSLIDTIIEPQRAPLVPHFDRVKAAAIASGALGCSLSGSGPTLFAWADSRRLAGEIGDKMSSEFKKAGIGSDAWVSPISADGARVMSED